ncbi:hypothetical protein MTR72_15125 [Bradyrhizobium sp. ISRA442]|uniref:hypothetical protein n=1 Tax=Bradyrhizobium sp. ISRA442 TaxID=2866197 RepID=UPI00311ABEFD
MKTISESAVLVSKQPNAYSQLQIERQHFEQFMAYNLLKLALQAREMATGCDPAAREFLSTLANRFEEEAAGQTAKQRTVPFWPIVSALCIALLNILLVTYSERDYLPPKPPPSPGAYKLPTPYRIYPDGFVYSAPIPQQFEAYADDDNDTQSSPVVLYEDDKPLAWPHARGYLVSEHGLGRYSLQPGHVFFSSSDNSDPRSNGRSYWLVLPSKSDERAP